MEEEDVDGLRRRDVKEKINEQENEVEGKLKIRISHVPKLDNTYGML